MNYSKLQLEKGTLLLCSRPDKREEVEASIIISLTETKPFDDVIHMPIEDMKAPSPNFEKLWKIHAAVIHKALDQGETVALHCAAGLGRTGTIAAKILFERGYSIESAISMIRSTRPGSIETIIQEQYLRRLDR